MENFVNSAQSRETSREIMEAIWDVSGKNETEANRVWDAPKDEELTAVFEIVTSNGLRDPELYAWGAAGTKWADPELDVQS